MREHYLNNDQILREIYDHEFGAVKTVPHQNQEFAIAVSHLDNDTVGVVAVQTTVGEGIHSCIGMTRCSLYGVGQVLVSPTIDGDDFVMVISRDTIEVTPIAICAMRIKVVGNAKLVMQGN